MANCVTPIAMQNYSYCSYAWNIDRGHGATSLQSERSFKKATLLPSLPRYWFNACIVAVTRVYLLKFSC